MDSSKLLEFSSTNTRETGNASGEVETVGQIVVVFDGECLDASVVFDASSQLLE
jgi:hypothetical protein